MRGRRNLDWVVGWWSEDLNGFATDGDTVELELLSQGDLDMYEDNVVVERVVGQFWLQNQSPDNRLVVAMRLAVRQAFNDGVGVVNVDLFNFSNAEEPFLWHKVIDLESLNDAQAGVGSNTNMRPDHHPEWSHIDCRVNRSLGDLDRLILEIDPLFVTSRFFYAAWIRVLVKC